MRDREGASPEGGEAPSRFKEGAEVILLGGSKVIQCQVAGDISVQACGQKADQIYLCEVIGPHDRHKVGEHTRRHALGGNGYACEAFFEEEHK